MPDYKTMYYKLMARVADAVELLVQAQQDGERAAMEEDQEPVIFIGRVEDDKAE